MLILEWSYKNIRSDFLKIVNESVITDTFGEGLFSKLDISEVINESLAFLLLQVP